MSQRSNSASEVVKTLQPAMDAAWAKWSVDFSKYAAVVLDYNGQMWPEPMRKAFVEYVRGGGGVFLVHAANNSFPDWAEFNEMIGIGWRKAGFGVALDHRSGDRQGRGMLSRSGLQPRLEASVCRYRAPAGASCAA